ncbi:MAG: VOC family protein [Acidobacteria bacterium]|nr:VOC family protein [Acidobacteriota bacterium]
MKLGMLMIFVSNLDKAKDFYCNILNFPLKAESETSLTFISGRQDLIAFKCASDSLVENYSQTARSVFVFEVDSISGEFSELKQKGVIFLHDKPSENEFCFYAAFRDPFGNIHEIAERKKL